MNYDGKKISIIIPCYNVEKYIDRCVLSLVQQTIGIDSLELIFVDDASTDRTAALLSQWEQQYPESIMVILCEENGRQGRARNIGLQYASAPCIGYVDSDDWVDIHMYEELYHVMQKEDVEVVSCLGARDIGDGVLFSTIEYAGSKNKRIEIVTTQERKELLSHSLGPIWTKLYRKSFLEKNDITFLEQTAYEDNYFGALTAYTVSSYYVLDKVYYHYYANMDSTITRKDSTQHVERLAVELEIWEALTKRGFRAEYEEQMKMRFLKMYYLNSLHAIFVKLSELPYTLLEEMRAEVLERVPDYARLEGYQMLSELEKGFLQTLEVKMTKERWKNLADNYRYLVQSKRKKS